MLNNLIDLTLLKILGYIGQINGEPITMPLALSLLYQDIQWWGVICPAVRELAASSATACGLSMVSNSVFHCVPSAVAPEVTLRRVDLSSFKQWVNLSPYHCLITCSKSSNWNFIVALVTWSTSLLHFMTCATSLLQYFHSWVLLLRYYCFTSLQNSQTLLCFYIFFTCFVNAKKTNTFFL